MISEFKDVCVGHFCAPKDLESMKAILSNCLRQVEIEVTSYCNRTCSFCPNSYLDRKSVKHFMDEGLYNSIINQLSSFNYSKSLIYARYSESLSDGIIFDRLFYARKMLPEASLRVITNGDYLSEKCLDRLTESGASTLEISGYLPNHVEFGRESVMQCIEKIEKRMGIALDWTDEWDGGHAFKEGKRGDLNISLRVMNFGMYGYDRGGLVKGKAMQRRSPCAMPFYGIYIDYNGKVVPCCNIRSDAPEHRDYVLGDAGKNSIFDIYFSKKSEGWRRSVFHFSDNMDAPCNTCGRIVYDDSIENRLYLDSVVTGRPAVVIDKMTTINRTVSILKEDKSSLQRECKKLTDEKSLMQREYLSNTLKMEEENSIIRRKCSKLEIEVVKLRNREMEFTAEVSILQALIRHIKGESWYKVGRKLGLLRHRTVADFRKNLDREADDERE